MFSLVGRQTNIDSDFTGISNIHDLPIMLIYKVANFCFPRKIHDHMQVLQLLADPKKSAAFAKVIFDLLVIGSGRL